MFVAVVPSPDDYEVAVRMVKETLIFPDDHGIVLRIFNAEARMEQTIDINNNKILAFSGFPMNKSQLEKTKTDEMLTGLRDIVKLSLGIDWNEVSDKDRHDRLVHTVAANLLLVSLRNEIPVHATDQAEVWIRHFNPKGSHKVFVEPSRHPRNNPERTGTESRTRIDNQAHCNHTLRACTRIVRLIVFDLLEGTKCFSQLCSGNCRNTIRGSDKHGSGHYGAPRDGRYTEAVKPFVNVSFTLRGYQSAIFYAKLFFVHQNFKQRASKLLFACLDAKVLVYQRF